MLRWRRRTSVMAYAEHPLEQRAKNVETAPVMKPSSLDEFANFVSTYTDDYVANITGYSKDRLYAVQHDRMLKDGKLNAYWITTNNNLQTAPNTNNETYPGYRNPQNFVVVSEAYPTVTAMAADVILPAAMWVEKEGAFGNAERRTQFWHELVRAPDQARSDLWQFMEFSKRFTTDEVWPE